MQECLLAHYIHYLAHELQVTFVVPGRHHDDTPWLLERVSATLNI